MMTTDTFSAQMQALADPDLGVTMLPRPEIGFAAIDDGLTALGFSQEPVHVAGQPLIAGEPNVAHWSFGGGNPVVVYSFNPVARLRVLEVGTLPPMLRRDLREKVPILTGDELISDLAVGDKRQRLRALWGLVALERVEALPPISTLAENASGPIAEEAERAARRLQDIQAAREKVLAGVRVVAASVMSVIARLDGSAACSDLLARPEDCAALFTADAAPGVAELLTAEPFSAEPKGVAQPESVEDVTACPAGLLRSHNALSRRFPIGYRIAAGWLQPDLIWVAWRGVGPDGSHFGHDGLVFNAGRWLYFPRPFQFLARVVPARPRRRESV